MVQFLPLDTSAIVSTVLEGVLYGFSVLMFIATIWILVANRKSEDINRPMVVIACLLFVFSTTVRLKFVRGGWLIVVFRDFPGGPAAWFANGSDSSFIFKNSVYTLQTALGDGVVIFRCYMVWRSFWILVLPILLWLGVCTTAIGGLVALAQPTATSFDIFVERTGQWITAFYATTLACNLVATGLLAYKLWSIDRNVHSHRVGRGFVKPVLLVVIDAGALYSITLFAALICFVLKSNGQYLILDLVTPIISIAFYMVILRIGIAQNTRSRSYNGASTLGSSNNRVAAARGDSGSAQSKSMHVHIERLTMVDRDRDLDTIDKSNKFESHQMSAV